MMVLITGGSKSGKSHLAEDLLKDYTEKLYIATMMPYGNEALAAIERHRLMRKGKGFATIEKYTDIEELSIGGRAVLLECMGNLLANEMFRPDPHADIASHILNGIKKLAEDSEMLVAVTSEVSMDGARYPESTREYIRLLGLINSEMAKLSDTVIECVYGIPVVLKGGKQVFTISARLAFCPCPQTVCERNWILRR